VMGLLVFQDLRSGRPLDVTSVVVVAVVVWVVMAGLVTFSKIRKGARRFGGSLGRAAVRNPRQDAGAAVGEAMDEALRASGAKKPDRSTTP
jgi:hypothetical protein